MAYVAVVKLKLPFFSVRNLEAFQIGSSLPLPPPSALIGALAYAIAVKEHLNSHEALTKTREIVQLARALVSSDYPIIPNSILLWRYRVLDKLKEFLKMIKELGNSPYLVKREVELKFKDALYREYIHVQELEAIYVVNREIESSLFKLISRLGDTESYCSVEDVGLYKTPMLSKQKVTEAEISHPLKYDTKYIKEIEGSYIILKMSDEREHLMPFILPIRREIKHVKEGKVVMYRPTKIRVRFSKPVMMLSFDNKNVVLL